jgi:hypothetical protein
MTTVWEGRVQQAPPQGHSDLFSNLINPILPALLRVDTPALHRRTMSSTSMSEAHVRGLHGHEPCGDRPIGGAILPAKFIEGIIRVRWEPSSGDSSMDSNFQAAIDCVCTRLVTRGWLVVDWLRSALGSRNAARVQVDQVSVADVLTHPA